MKTKVFFYVPIFAFIMALSACGGSGNESHDHATETTAQVQYTCPMHPEIVQDEPGNCPKCNMKLEVMKAEQETDENL